MKLTVTPAPQSSLTLEIELPAEDLDAALLDAVRVLARRTRVPGFRPGKAPRVMIERMLGPDSVISEAVEHLTERGYRDALIDLRVLPLARPEVAVTQGEEGKPLQFAATIQVRPEVKLGDYRAFNFTPEIEEIDDPKVEKVLEELRDQQAILEPVEGRGAQTGDYAVIGFEGTRDGQAFPGGTAERMPLIIGDDRLIPGFEANLLGLSIGDSTEFDVTFPDDYAEQTLAGQQAHFAVNVLQTGQQPASIRFATRHEDRFGLNDWSPGEYGAPVLEKSLGVFECAAHGVHDGGDHHMLIGRVVKARFDASLDPLLYFRGSYRRLHFD